MTGGAGFTGERLVRASTRTDAIEHLGATLVRGDLADWKPWAGAAASLSGALGAGGAMDMVSFLLVIA